MGANQVFVQDVVHPYTICTAIFPDATKQAVYAAVENQDAQGERAASCVIDAPEMSSDLHAVDARIQISGAAGPRGKLQTGDEYVMQFIQPPAVLDSHVHYDESIKPGYYISVSLQDSNGMKKVCTLFVRTRR